MRTRLIEARKSKGLSQEEAAEACEVSRAAWGQWERNEATPNPRQREKIALVLETSLTEVHSLLSSVPETANQQPTKLKIALAVEGAAIQMRSHVQSVVHGLLQIPGYTAAIARSVGTSGTSDEYVQRNLGQRAHRQRRVLNGDLELHALTPETALRSCLGGPKVMAASASTRRSGSAPTRSCNWSWSPCRWRTSPPTAGRS